MAFSTRRMASKAILPEETPYLRAAQQWDHRIGDARAQARNWRLMAFSSIAIAGIFAAGFAYEATRVKVAAYYVPVDEIGRPGHVELVGNVYTPSNAAIIYFLSEWTRTMFAKPTDPIVAREDLLKDFSVLRGNAATGMNQWASANDPMKDIGHVARTVAINAVLQRSDQSWQVDWTELTFTDGSKSNDVKYTGLFTVETVPPTNQSELLANPLGLHITAINWSREGVSP
jgi:type IV secretory pathway TrbF-like protein